MKKTLSMMLALLLVLSLCGCNDGGDATTGTTTVPSSGPISPTGPLYERSSYTVTDADAIAAHDQTVVQIGSESVSNGLLQFAYWSDYFTFLDLNAYYATMLGLDYTQPLDQQIMNNTTYTWQHYFLRETLDGLHETVALYLEAEAADLDLPAELIAELDGLEQALEDAAKENDFETGIAYLISRHGPGTTKDDFIRYMRMTYLGSYYYSLQLENITVTDQKINDYYNTNQAELNQSGVNKDGTTVNHIRHIMLAVENYSDKEDATREDATEEDWAKCRQAAEALLNTWLTGEKTEASFAALATEHSKDEGSNYNGGLYKGCTDESSFEQSFRDWYMEAGRQPGDYGLVKTEYGYHILYFVEREETWHYQCGQAVYNVSVEQISTDVIAKHPITVDYSKIVLGVAQSSVFTEE